jgi:chaperonin GroEL (HSP60 family)
MIDEAERALNDALFVISDVAELAKMVPGGGAIETELSKVVRSYATQVGGREQLAIEAFADALEVIPRTLADNAGLDILDTMVALKAAHDKDDGFAIGVNVYDEGVIDMLEQGVVEPMVVKQQAVKSAVEVSSMILRIDDVVAASSSDMGGGGPGPGDMPDTDEDI